MENILKVKNKILDSKNTGRETPLFQAAKENDMKSLMQLIGDESTDPLEKGAFGERVLHVAALYNNHEILIALLDAYPFLINYPMECETYKGEYALSFAACIGNEEILQLLVESGAPLHAQDKQGNTVFHMLVLHPNKMMACKMYDFLISLISKEKVPYLENIANKQGFTPLKLAAHEGNPKMFEYFIGKKRRTVWTFGPVISSLYDLTGIDTWDDQKSVMDIICTSKNKAALHLLELTPLKELLHHKWTRFGHKYFLLWTVLSVVYTLIFTACCVYRPINPAIKNSENATIKIMKKINEAYSMSDDFVRMAGEITIVLGAFLILLIEVRSLKYHL
ncbi:transient receptor potential cation channel subfamily V member 5-like [Tachyglossus aculeatus]|uniref:transient receptor potential cation channel subfamily V member 5-like n=1 Tax=Tachyglossus aculeatus TaxID=9261 RepID=UPI0018F30230|nr:transient receptor potential cation channel subfamily V member 5-like [Tachyglossus aculeatus]